MALASGQCLRFSGVSSAASLWFPELPRSLCFPCRVDLISSFVWLFSVFDFSTLCVFCSLSFLVALVSSVALFFFKLIRSLFDFLDFFVALGSLGSSFFVFKFRYFLYLHSFVRSRYPWISFFFSGLRFSVSSVFSFPRLPQWPDLA